MVLTRVVLSHVQCGGPLAIAGKNLSMAFEARPAKIGCHPTSAEKTWSRAQFPDLSFPSPEFADLSKLLLLLY